MTEKNEEPSNEFQFYFKELKVKMTIELTKVCCVADLPINLSLTYAIASLPKVVGWNATIQIWKRKELLRVKTASIKRYD